MKENIAYFLMWIFSKIDKFLASDEEKKLFKKCALRVNAHIDEECEKLHIKKPRFVIIGLISSSISLGECYGANCIRIDPLKEGDYVKTLRHELRHCWQWKHYANIMRWARINLDKRVDRNQYWYNPVEIDARVYAEHSVDSNIMDIPVDSLSAMKENGSLIEQMWIIANFYGDIHAENDFR